MLDQMRSRMVVELPSMTTLIAASAVFYAIYWVYWQWTVGASRRAIIKENGCKPLRHSDELNGFPRGIFGGSTVVENLRALSKRGLLELMHRRFMRNGNTYHLKTFFTDLTYTIEPENIKAILATQFKDFELPDRRVRAFDPLLGQGIFTSNGPAWQHSRDLLRPNFIRSQVTELDNFEQHIHHLIEAIPTDGSTVDLQELFFLLTIDSATQFLFGESTNILSSNASDAEKSRFAEAFNRSQVDIAWGIRTGFIHKMWRSRQFGEDVEYVHNFVDRYVHKGLEYRRSLAATPEKEKDQADSDDRYVFLYELVKATTDPIRIRSELLNILLAGRDTTASLLSSVFFELARRPDIWAKLKAEVENELHGERPTFEQLKDMRYLKWVMNETLRLHPPVPLNARMSTKDTTLPLGGGPDGKSPLFIPARTNIIYLVWSMHRRTDLYGPDAADFRPERWETIRPGWEYLPFNGGPRICIGQQYALTEASYTTVRLLQEFSAIEARDSRPWQELITLTCAIAQGTLVSMTR